MSNEKKERTVSDVHNEYTNLCARAGHIQYNIAVMSKDLELVNEQLKELNLEAAKLANKEAVVSEAPNA